MVAIVSDKNKIDEFSNWNSYLQCKKQFVSTHSRNQWVDICMKNVPNYFKNIGFSNSEIQSAFEIIEDFMLEIGEKPFQRDIMIDFEEMFKFLVKCAQVQELNIRSRAQSLFSILLKCFEPIAQQLLLCRLFELIANHQIEIEMEPQVLAWLIDTYRKKLHDEKCCKVFLDEVAHFYGQIILIKYEDMISGLHFYVSTLLLLADQAVAGTNLEFLRALKTTLIDKIQNQLSDFLHLKQLKSQEKKIDQFLPEEPIFALELVKFTLADTTAKLKKALSGS